MGMNISYIFLLPGLHGYKIIIILIKIKKGDGDEEE